MDLNLIKENLQKRQNKYQEELDKISKRLSNKGFVKLTCGIAKGKKKIDKRESIKQRDWNIKKQRLLKNN